jgi:hypothetical protein
MHIQIDYAEPTIEIQAKQVQWIFGGQHASNYEDANIFVIKISLSASNHHP